ncbi:hypothetical protein [Sinorhizobium fredii]|uniref:hypothetical protein n=1 Tax=Rhizobium fredii TaxID=380 RepID=UPI0011D1AE4F|nr:hypothetical protein [Sinorhizobium fredii]
MDAFFAGIRRVGRVDRADTTDERIAQFISKLLTNEQNAATLCAGSSGVNGRNAECRSVL